jgi:hypothetical protein
MVAWHWYNELYVVYNTYGGHSHVEIRPLGWLVLAILVGVIGYAVMRNR